MKLCYCSYIHGSFFTLTGDEAPNRYLNGFYPACLINYLNLTGNAASTRKIFLGFYIRSINDYPQFFGKSPGLGQTLNTVIEKILHLPDRYLGQVIGQGLRGNWTDPAVFIFSSPGTPLTYPALDLSFLGNYRSILWFYLSQSPICCVIEVLKHLTP